MQLGMQAVQLGMQAVRIEAFSKLIQKCASSESHGTPLSAVPGEVLRHVAQEGPEHHSCRGLQRLGQRQRCAQGPCLHSSSLVRD